MAYRTLYLLSLYMTSFDEQVTSFSLHAETSFVSQSDFTGVLSYNYQASPVSERSCPWSFQANLKVFSTKKNKRYVYAHHTTFGDLLGSSHIVDDMENPSRFSEEILRCISSMYITLSGRARTSSCIQASPSSKTRFDSWNPCLGDIKEANAPRGVVIESLKLHLDDSCFNNL
ncbi:hypothetical protein Rs2_37106 [Raphanus sativus]|nr:hypothetical protein Rs2_37106 [Raphanus sativus]